MNQSKLAEWIEQAEARAVCELAISEARSMALSPLPLPQQASGAGRVIKFLCRVGRRFEPGERVRSAA